MVKRMKIGKSTNNAGAEDGYFEGLVDEVRLWQYEMSSEEILNVYCDNGPGPDDLIGHWNFNDGTDPTIEDQSGSNNNGTLSGDTDNFSLEEVYNNNGVCPVASECFDTEITELDFPYNHLADLITQDDDWNQSEFPYPGGGSHSNGANGNDHTYKLTLTSRRIYTLQHVMLRPI